MGGGGQRCGLRTFARHFAVKLFDFVSDVESIEWRTDAVDGRDSVWVMRCGGGERLGRLWNAVGMRWERGVKDGSSGDAGFNFIPNRVWMDFFVCCDHGYGLRVFLRQLGVERDCCHCERSKISCNFLR